MLRGTLLFNLKAGQDCCAAMLTGNRSTIKGGQVLAWKVSATLKITVNTYAHLAANHPEECLGADG